MPLKLLIPKFFKKALGLCAFYIFCIVGPAEAACLDNMTVYWKLDEDSGNIYAASVGNDNGQCAGVCPRADIREGINGTQIFDGSTTGINVPSSSVFNWTQTDSFSVEFWAKRGSGELSEDEVCVGRYDGANGLEWWVGISTAGVAKFVLTNINTESFLITGTTNIADDVWHHIIVTRDASDNEISIVIDGQEEGAEAATYSAGFESDAADLNIGWLNDAGTGHHFDGVIDEIALYDDVVSDELISQHLHNGLADFRWGYCDIPQQIRIMPLGDSITAGVAVVNGQRLEDEFMVGYRQKLWSDLVGLGYDVDFVGTQTYGQSAESTFDTDDEGHPGWTDAQIAENIFNWLTLNPAQIVLLHIGTNGLNLDPGDVENILDNIDSYDENITVILARIINRSEYSADTTSFNNNIEAMAKERIATGDKIIIVDMENALVYPDDLSDELHPNSDGYEKMADVWLENLIRLTSFSDMVPSITSVPETEATVATTYTYEIEAIGTPPLTYVLAAGAPDDMIIDRNTGLIEWTPFDEGRFDITVLVANSAGEAEQSFTIEVSARENQAPTADAGEDQFVTEGTTVTLDASASSDPDGGIISYKWEQVAGTSVTLSDPSDSETTFIAPEVGTFALSFRLTVEDKGRLKGVDTVNITVNDNGITIFPDDVISFFTVTGHSIGIRVESGGQLVKLGPTEADTASDTVDRPEDIIYGLLDVAIKVDTPGETAIITLFLPESAEDGFGWYEYSEADGWRSYGNDAVFDENRDQITLTLTDGGTRDNSTLSAPDGFIRSLSGLGRMPSSKKEEKDDLISCFIRSASVRDAGIVDRVSVIFFICMGTFLLSGFRKAGQK